MVEEGASQALKPAVGAGRTCKATGPAFRTSHFLPRVHLGLSRQFKYNRCTRATISVKLHKRPLRQVLQPLPKEQRETEAQRGEVTCSRSHSGKWRGGIPIQAWQTPGLKLTSKHLTRGVTARPSLPRTQGFLGCGASRFESRTVLKKPGQLATLCTTTPVSKNKDDKSNSNSR